MNSTLRIMTKKRHLHLKSRTSEQPFLIVSELRLHGNRVQETYVSSPDFSRQISASCTAAPRSSVSSDVTSPALALLLLMSGWMGGGEGGCTARHLWHLIKDLWQHTRVSFPHKTGNRCSNVQTKVKYTIKKMNPGQKQRWFLAETSYT